MKEFLFELASNDAVKLRVTIELSSPLGSKR